ncbi:dihydrofolate reductase family protein [Pyxidicoccus parkwayensis]|uniref:Dihydrofolate reductase family protein n=1 Tax=Pyxidicoccus parkwayensis TaxID=2813578 RepID=A0ABX7NSI1_9BACT|nr:dihydrofolate reductase family protein [Pyxidicoccus parkwaysis]QSQ21837.1 dihydrofolate reductase family protein [Pyxidicoccus parkwaysis]
MRKLVLKMHMSLDGFVGGPKGEVEWVFHARDDKATAWVVDGLWNAGAHLMGRRTYGDMAAHWPKSTAPYAAPMNQIPKVVFSKTLKQATWTDSRIASGDLVEEVTRLKQEPGKDLLAHGGAGFAQSLVKHGLVDEYQLLIHPVALGSGLRLFPEREQPLKLRLVSATRFDSGAVAHVYRPE